jgi:penicillin-binding protein 1A
MTPYYTAAVWFGYDSQITINTNEHKTMWRDIMDKIATMENQSPEADWKQPEGLVKTSVCKLTGLAPNSGCPICNDWFDKENIPKKKCKGHVNKVVVCNESHCLATNTCPETTEYYITYDDQGNMQLVGANFEYDKSLFSTKCPLHPEVEGGLRITTSAGKGGTISDSVDCKAGDDVTIYINPSSGYEIKDVKVDGKSKGPISEYKFKNVNEPHKISVKFKKIGGGDDDEPQDTEAPPPATEQPTTEAPPPATEQPVTEAPATVAPVTEQPVTEQPVTEAPPPVTEQPVTEAPPPETPPEGGGV